MAGLVLAAGASSRMGEGFKLLLSYRDGDVVQASVGAAVRAGLDPVVVVTGHRGEEVRRTLKKRFNRDEDPRETGRPGPEAPGPGRVMAVHNARYAEGQATSLARGVREVRTATEAAAAAVLVGDEPGIAAAAVRKVVEAWRRRAEAARARSAPADAAPPVLRARYRDRPGHPVVFPRDAFGELEALEGDRGARRWLERNPGRVEELRLEAAAPVDVDTGDDYRKATGADGGEAARAAREGEGDGTGIESGSAKDGEPG